MDSLDLTREQAAELRRQLAPSLRFLRRLQERMEQQAFPRDDELRQLVETAYKAVHSLNVRLHYLRCTGDNFRQRPQR